VPDGAQETLRDLTRAREDMKHLQRQAKQRLLAFLLRHGRCYGGKSNWTLAHYCWMEEVKFEHPVQQIVFQEYIDTVKAMTKRIDTLDKQVGSAAGESVFWPVIEGLMALRGVNLLTATTIVAEIGDLRRFASAPQLMAYLGVVPSEHSSGGAKSRGGITKTGNGHVRRVLVEAAWTYRHPARKTTVLQKRAEQTSEAVQEIAWKAQMRLCGRYRRFEARGKLKVQACTAIARELAGFIWAIGQALPQHVIPGLEPTRGLRPKASKGPKRAMPAGRKSNGAPSRRNDDSRTENGRAGETRVKRWGAPKSRQSVTVEYRGTGSGKPGRRVIQP